jgi:hypothetical protein
LRSIHPPILCLHTHLRLISIARNNKPANQENSSYILYYYTKNKEKQFVEDTPVIIAIKARQWRMNFEEEYKKFLELKEAIQDELKQYSDISGVIIFSSDLYNGRYIENEIASPGLEITESELQSSGIIKVHANTEF